MQIVVNDFTCCDSLFGHDKTKASRNFESGFLFVVPLDVFDHNTYPHDGNTMSMQCIYELREVDPGIAKRHRRCLTAPIVDIFGCGWN